MEQYENATVEVPTITVWVHGTKSTVRKLPFKKVRLFFDCLPGLNHWQELEVGYHHRKIAELLHTGDPRRFSAEHFYIFGWSGLLSFQARKQAAHELHEHLAKLIASYVERYDVVPRIRVITHSHGGNVVLNLAAIEPAYTIDELILLACPVQAATSPLISHPLFKKIYHLFSTTDMFQVLDMQGLYHNGIKSPLFSARRFACQPNLVQVAIKMGRRSLAHIEFLLQPFLQVLPIILDQATTWHRDAAPTTNKHGTYALSIKQYLKQLPTA